MIIAKIVLFVIIFFCLGILVLPSTVSLLVGEHAFYNLSRGYGSRCIKCHADVYDELEHSANHSTVDGANGLSGEECLACHRANTTITYAQGGRSSFW